MAHLVYGETPSFGASHRGQAQQVVPLPTTLGSLRIILLHGNLEIWLHEARNLPNRDMFHNKLGDIFSMLARKLGSKIESHMSHNVTTSDPYVTVSVGGAVIARTFVIRNDDNPVWMQHFNVPVAHHAAEVHYIVKDSDIVGSQIIGAVGIPVEEVCNGKKKKIEGLFPILNGRGKPYKPGTVLSLSIQYTPIDKVALYSHGVGAGPDYQGVSATYFPLRKGGQVTLYQDAHVHEGCLPSLKVDRDVNYEHRSCWHDIFDAISQARKLVYIVGWCVYYNVSLVRDNRDGKACILSDLLKAKSQEGVRVLLLVWDDPTYRSMLGYKTVGLMNTHDDDTRHFFKHSSVRVLWPRDGGKGHSLIKTQFKTMQMMYETIYKALHEAGLDNEHEPQDSLNFFCLGNREIPDNENISKAVNPTGKSTPQVLTQKSRRFMIYVHSKGMIVDVEYVLLGSANINKRSMEGTRDTGVAMGAYQPTHPWASKQSKPHGQVRGYRMSLCGEHIGGVEECFEQPESLECVRRIRSLSEFNWRQYIADEVTEMKSHLLKYTLEIDSKGKVPIFGCETFPNVGGNIKGTFTVRKENLSI